MANHIKDLAGNRYGMLTVLHLDGRTNRGRAKWKCLCDCGQTKTVPSSSLTKGWTSSCGCFTKRQASQKLLDDISGQTFGRLTAIARSEKRSMSGNAYWTCRCSCGAVKDILGTHLKNGNTQSCGCLRRELRIDNLTGKRFGRLTVIAEAQGHADVYWTCQCDCGNLTEVSPSNLKSGEVTSCGCYRRDSLVKDLVGKRFGRLVVVGFEYISNHASYWRAICDCGNSIVAKGQSLVAGSRSSCGCYHRHRCD